MDENRASITALVTAYFRAYHATHDFPIIFDDSLADKLYTAEEHAAFDQNLAGTLKAIDPARAAATPDPAAALAVVMQGHYAPITLSRSRFSEDTLERAIARGVTQYVILGAGMDTFAYRRPDLTAKLQIFELDHPATQEMKRERLARLNMPVPAQLHFLPVDFRKMSVEQALSQSTHDPEKLTFFSWLGVTYYLTPELVFASLAAIPKLAPPGSAIVFDYLHRDAFLPGKAVGRVQFMQDRARQVGEPMISGFAPALLGEEIKALGLNLVENLGPAEIEARYFQGRTDEYHAFEQVYFARAEVSGSIGRGGERSKMGLRS